MVENCKVVPLTTHENRHVEFVALVYILATNYWKYLVLNGYL